MLLDDESILPDGLATLTAWVKDGFTLAAAASNGIAGLEKAQEYQPDAVKNLHSNAKRSAYRGLGLRAEQVFFFLLLTWSSFQA